MLGRITKFQNSDGMLSKISGIIFTFSIVLLAWVFFRANSLNEALYIIKNIFSSDIQFFVGDRSHVVYGFMGIITVILMESRLRSKAITDVLQFRSKFLQWSMYYMIIFSIVIFGMDKGGQFIYFQF